jgi:hypothetical protein
MRGCGIASLDPLQNQGHQDHALLCPLPNPAGLRIPVIGREGIRTEVVAEVLRLRVQHWAFRDGAGVHLHQLGQPGPVAGEVEAIAIYPAVIAALAPWYQTGPCALKRLLSVYRSRLSNRGSRSSAYWPTKAIKSWTTG